MAVPVIKISLPRSVCRNERLSWSSKGLSRKNKFNDMTCAALLRLRTLQGSVAYVAQQAWIQNLTVQENITFGKAMDESKYQCTVEACELKEDFQMLPGGDQTEIGERVSTFEIVFISWARSDLR